MLSIDKKVSLVYYLKEKGADPNLKKVGLGRAAIIEVYDPVLMEALLDIGADPTLRDNWGLPALTHFFYGYQYYYPNKNYFRLVVERILKMGGDSSNYGCFVKFSSDCALNVANNYGDKELSDLLRRYIK